MHPTTSTNYIVNRVSRSTKIIRLPSIYLPEDIDDPNTKSRNNTSAFIPHIFAPMQFISSPQLEDKTTNKDCCTARYDGEVILSSRAWSAVESAERKISSADELNRTLPAAEFVCDAG